MRKTIHFAIIGFIALCMAIGFIRPATAGSAADSGQAKILNPTDAIELLRADMDTQKKNIIAHSMEMTEKESEIFWPLYKEYQVELEKLNSRSINLVKDFLKRQKTISDADAENLLQEFLAIEKERLAQKEKYVKNFSKTLPAHLVLKYFQLENKVESALRWSFAEEIPLVK